MKIKFNNNKKNEKNILSLNLIDFIIFKRFLLFYLGKKYNAKIFLFQARYFSKKASDKGKKRTVSFSGNLICL